MPGIVGILRFGGPIDRERQLEPMIKTMLHERFYVSGQYQNPRMGCEVGWVCHEGSFSDCMPIWNESKDICLFFSGEHFSDRAEIDRLQAAGHACSGDTADYLVHLYEEYGAKFLEMLNGCFSGLLIDLRERKVILFNDRYGLGRIYYHQTAEALYFASEAKALLKVLPQLRRLDMQSFGEHFACGCVLQNRTLFSGISLVPGGSAWTFRPPQEVRKESYFRKEVWENQPLLSPSEYYVKLRQTFNRILPRYFAGKQPLGLSLTGGLDTRMIVACTSNEPFKMQCYTFGGLYRECADVRIARQVAKATQQDHQVIELNRNFFSEFPVLANRAVYFTDGAMDVTGAVGLFNNRVARQIAPIRLTGNYGDEVLRGATAFKADSKNTPMLDDQFALFVRRAASTYSSETECPLTSFIAFKQVPWHHYSRLAMEQSQLTMRTPYLDNDLVSVVYQAPPEMASSKLLARRIIADGNPSLAMFPTDRGPLGRPGMLGKLREAWQEFTFKAEYAYDYGMPQWLARFDHALAPLHLERLFLGRHKYYHFRIWYRKELSEHVKEVLLDPHTLSRPYLNRRRVEHVVTSHVAGLANYTSAINKLLTSEIILRELIDEN